MLGRREVDAFNTFNKKVVQAGDAADNTSSSAAPAPYSPVSALTITTIAGDVLTISEYISRSDEAAQRRLGNMNQKLRGLEMQMEALETEIGQADSLAPS